VTQLFKDTFASDSFSSWTGVYGTPSVVATPGNFEICPASAQIPATNYVYTTIGSNATSYFRAYVYLAALPPNSSLDQELLSVWSTSNNSRTGVLSVKSTGQFYISWHGSGSWQSSSNSVSVLAAGQWYCLELYTVIGTSGATKVYLNGVEETACTLTGINNSDRWIGTLGIDVGGSGGTTGSVVTTYYTDVIVADQYVGPDNLAVNNLTVYGNAGIANLNVTSGLTLNSSAGSGGQVLTSNGSSNAPTWQTVSSGSGSYTGTNGVVISGSVISLDSSYSPTFAGLTLNGVINSHASGSYPVAGSNAGMILDCYTPNHRDGLGIQTGGIWLKYDNNFNIYYDNGSTVLTALALDSSRNTKLISLNVQNDSGTYGYIGLGDINPTFVKASGYPLGINHNSPAIIGSSATSKLLFDAQLGSNGTLTNFWTAFQSKGSNALQLAPSGSVITKNNTLDDGAFGAMSILGNLNVGGNATVTGRFFVNAIPATVGGITFTAYNGSNQYSTYLNAVSAGIMDPTKPILWAQYGMNAGGDINAYGLLGSVTDPNSQTGTGGGAVQIGHSYTDTGDFAAIVLTDYPSTLCSGHSTLWLKYAGNSSSKHMSDWLWGNLELGNLFTHSYVVIAGSFAGGVTGYGYLNSAGSVGYSNTNTGNVNISLQTSYRIFCGGEIDVYSDQRDKNLVEALSDQTSLNAIMKLNPLHFAWKPETQKGDNVVAGFFAQEVAKAIPEAVTVYEGERYADEHSLNYNVLTTYALSAIQCLTLRHNEDADRLTRELEELRSEIKRIVKLGVS